MAPFKLERLSASAVDTFDASTAFGCARKGWFQYVEGLRPPQDPSAALGEQVHLTIEQYLRTGICGLHPIALAGRHHIDPYVGQVIAVEHKFGPGVKDEKPLMCEGIPFSGRIDLVCSPRQGEPFREIVDWKTTSSIERYAKTVAEARKSTQMGVYMNWWFTQEKDHLPIRTSFIYFQTKGTASEKVTTVVDKEFAAERWTVIGGLVRLIKDVCAETDVSKVEPNLRACDMARGCPFRSRCPRRDPLGVLPMSSNPKGEVTMSLLDRFKMPASAAPAVSAPAPTAPPVTATAPAAIPAPAPAAPRRALVVNVPAEGAEAFTTAPAAPEPFEPVPAKRGPGRPRKDATALRETDFRAPMVANPGSPQPVAQTCAGACEKNETNKAAAKAITKVTVRHGLTINLGNYQSARVEVELESTSLSTEELGKEVTKALEIEVRPYMPKEQK